MQKKKNTATFSKYAVVGNSAKKTSCETISNNLCIDSENINFMKDIYL